MRSAVVAGAVMLTAIGVVAAAVALDGSKRGKIPAQVAGGVAGTQMTIDARWPNRAEQAWLKRYVRWEDGFVRDVERAFGAAEQGRTAAGVAAVRSAAKPFASCASALPVGKPPSARLRLLADHVRRACRSLSRGFEIMTSSGAGQNRDERVDFEFEQAGRAIAAARGMLPLGAKRPLPERAGRATVSRIEPRFSRAASEVAEKEVEVRCWSKADWRRLTSQYDRLGHHVGGVQGFVVATGGKRIHLSPYLCASLSLAVYGDPATEKERARAGEGLLALAHEAQHAAGVADEAAATCYALQVAGELGYALDLDRGFIDRQVQVYWREYAQLPAEYRSPQCRAGGKLDRHPGDGDWP